MKKIYIICALVLALVAAMALTAQAYRIDFEIAAVQPSTALTFWNGGTNPLVGQSILIDKITGIDTPLHPGNAGAVTGSWLWNFQSAPFSGQATDHWFFAGATGSSSTITGSFGGLTNPITSATFVEADVHNIVAGGVNGYAVSGTFRDIKSPSLLSYFGVGGNPYTAQFTYEIFLNGNIQPPTAFPSTFLSFVSSGDITNFPVPVPPSAILLGTGLLGLVGLRFRRK